MWNLLDRIKQLSVLLLCIATVPVFLYIVSNRPSTPNEEPSLNPWTFDTDGLACDSGPNSVGNWCYRSKVFNSEILRRKINEQGLCDSEAGRKSIDAILQKNPDACNGVKLAGYDEAVVRNYTPILEAMRRDQGIALPELSANEYRECALDRYKQLYKNDPPIMFEMVYRKCAKGIDVGARLR